MQPCSESRRGYGILGLLITMACIVVLFSILMTSVNKAVTGQGSPVQGTVRSFQDEFYLRSIFQSLLSSAAENQSRYLTPSDLYGSSGDLALNTTANLFSAFVMQNQFPCKQLIGGNEYNPMVEEMADYDFSTYSPSRGVYWDSRFKADLNQLSNVSFAHVPLHGERFRRHWKGSMSSTFPILGNRGPKDGEPNADSYTYGRNKQWGGHLVFGDGHIEFVTSFNAANVVLERSGQRYSDNVYKIEEGPDGADAIISFTRTMSRSGPELQFD